MADLVCATGKDIGGPKEALSPGTCGIFGKRAVVPGNRLAITCQLELGRGNANGPQEVQRIGRCQRPGNRNSSIASWARPAYAFSQALRPQAHAEPASSASARPACTAAASRSWASV